MPSSSSYCWKLRALMKKNIILMKRNLISTLFEIFFPVILVVVILALKQAFNVVTYNFSEMEGSIEKYISDKSMSSFNYDTSINTDYDPLSASWLGLSALPPFQICSPMNNQGEARPIIASIGIPQEIKDQMIKDSEKFESMIYFKLTSESFKEFNSINEMEELIKTTKYLQEKSQLICFGLQFSYNEDTKKYNYSLHFFDFEKTGREGVEDIPNNKEGMYDPFQSGPDLTAYMKYKNGAYSYMMRIVNQYILRKETNKPEA